jgi:hypothetical protein
MKIKDVLQELKKYNVDLDSNVLSIKKIDNKIIFRLNDVRTKEKPKKGV